MRSWSWDAWRAGQARVPTFLLTKELPGADECGTAPFLLEAGPVARGRHEGAKGDSVMQNILRTRVLATRMDDPDGALGLRKMVVLIVGLLVLGAALMLMAQQMILNFSLATVTGVAQAAANVTLDVNPHEVSYAAYAEDMKLAAGDRVVVRIDPDRGNSVIWALGQ